MPENNGPLSVEGEGHQKKVRRFLEAFGSPFPEDATEEILNSAAQEFILNHFSQLPLDTASQAVAAICEKFSNGAAKQLMEGFLTKLEGQMRTVADIETALDLALELRKLSVNPSDMTDFILQKHSLVNEMGFPNFSRALVRLVQAATTSPGIVLSRVLTLVTKNELLKKAEDFDVLCKILETGIYPTPRIFSQLTDMADDRAYEREYLQILHERMNRIRTDESINADDPLDLELYYNYLNVSINYETFSEMMRAVENREIPPIPPHFTPFRISTRGVEALTEDIDHKAVKEILNDVSEASRVESARSFLAGLPQMSKKEMSTAEKYEMMGVISMTVTDRLTKTGQMAAELPNPFNKTNIFGETENLLKLKPSYEKMAWLNYARFELGQFIQRSETLFNENKLVQKEHETVQGNMTRAKELGKKCRAAFIQDLDAVLDQFVNDPEGYRNIHVIHDMMMEFRFGRDCSEEELKLYRKITEAAYAASFAHIETLNSEDLSNILGVASVEFFKAGVESPGSRRKLWECLRHQTLINSSAISEEITTGKTEVALQATHELYRDRIPDQLAKNLEPEQGLGHDFSEILRDAILEEAQDVAGGLRGSLTSVGKQLGKKGAGEQLMKEFQAFNDSLSNKIKEYEKNVQKIKRGVQHMHPAHEVKMLAGTCKFHTSNNRSIDKLLQIPGISEFEKKLLEDLKRNIVHYGELLSLPKELLDQVRRTCDRDGDYESLKESLAVVRKGLDKEVKKRFPAYSEYVEARKKLEADHIMEKTRRKNLIYTEYLAQLEETEQAYDPAEFNLRVRPVVKETDQEFSAKYKSLRKDFETNIGDSIKKVNQAQRLSERLEGFSKGLSPLDEVQREALGAVTAQIDKITYRDLGEDEFEFVPSKRRGDMVKAWVSDDCSKDTAHGRQLCNPNFVNYRAYKTVNGERAWVGNVYVLDALWGHSTATAQPVLLFDAVQVSRSTQVNGKLFMQGVIDGFAKIARDNNYAFIVSNEITSTGEGYLVSNRPQLREAYIRLTSEKSDLPMNMGGLSLLHKEAAHTFQALTHGDGTFKILWSHPDAEPVVQLGELKKFLGQVTDAETLDSLMRKAKSEPFAFSLNFQSKNGYERLLALQSNPAKLQLYITLMNRYFGYKAAQAILSNEADLELLGQFDQLGEDYAELALHFLYSGRRAVHFFLREVLAVSQNADEDTKTFYKRLLYDQMMLRPEEIEEVKPLCATFDKAQAGSQLLKAYRHYGEFGIAGLKKLAGLIEEGVLDAGDRPIVEEMMMNSSFLSEDFALERLVKSLKRFTTLVPVAAKTVLNAPYLAVMLRGKTFKNLDELEGFVEGFDFGEDAISKDDKVLLDYAARILIARRHTQLRPLRDVFKTMLAAEQLENEFGVSENTDEDESEEEAKTSEKHKDHPFKARDLFNCLLDKPTELPDCLAAMENLKTAERKNERAVLLGHLLKRKASGKKLLLMSSVADENIERMYFYLANLRKTEVEATDTLETLHDKFIQEKYTSTGMDKLKDIDRLIRTGEDFGFVKKGHEEILQSFFELRNLAAMPQAQMGETEKAKKRKSEEEVPKGYVGLPEFMSDQKSVYSFPFHQ